MELPVDNKEFLYFRKKVSKTQRQMAQLLGTSIKAVHNSDIGERYLSTELFQED